MGRPILIYVWAFFALGEKSRIGRLIATARSPGKGPVGLFVSGSPSCESRVSKEKDKAKSFALALANARRLWRGPDHCQALIPESLDIV